MRRFSHKSLYKDEIVLENVKICFMKFLILILYLSKHDNINKGLKKAESCLIFLLSKYFVIKMSSRDQFSTQSFFQKQHREKLNTI